MRQNASSLNTDLFLYDTTFIYFKTAPNDDLLSTYYEQHFLNIWTPLKTFFFKLWCVKYVLLGSERVLKGCSCKPWFLTVCNPGIFPLFSRCGGERPVRRGEVLCRWYRGRLYRHHRPPSGGHQSQYHGTQWHRLWVGYRFHRKVPDSNVHGANMGPICGRQDPGGPHVGPYEPCYLGYYTNVSQTSSAPFFSPSHWKKKRLRVKY